MTVRRIARAGVALGVFVVVAGAVVRVMTMNAPAAPGLHTAVVPIASDAAYRSGPGNVIRGPVALSLDRGLGPIASGAAGPYSADQVLVGFKRGTSAARQRSIENGAGGIRARRLGIGVSLTVGRGDVSAVIGRLRRDRAVRYAEPDYVMQADGLPNDPGFPLQWGLQNTGQAVDGTAGAAGADEHVAPAWSVTSGSASVVVAVADTGVEYTHPDLAANMWSNSGGWEDVRRGLTASM